MSKETILNENAFKNPLGKFSENKYFQSLNNAGLTEKKYLKMIQTEGNFKQLSMPFQFNYIYDNKVVKAIIDWQNEIRDIEFDFVKYLDKKSDDVGKLFKNTTSSRADFDDERYNANIVDSIDPYGIFTVKIKGGNKINSKNLSDEIALKHSSFRGEEYLDQLSKSSLSKLVNFPIEQLSFWFGAAMYCCSSDNETQSMTGKFIVNTELKFFTLVYEGLQISQEMSLQEFIKFSHRIFIESVSNKS